MLRGILRVMLKITGLTKVLKNERGYLNLETEFINALEKQLILRSNHYPSLMGLRLKWEDGHVET